MNQKRKITFDIIFNIIIILSVSIGMPIHIAVGQSTGLDGEGWQALYYFTNLSNIFCAGIALWIVILEIRMLIKKEEKELPFYLSILRQMAASGVAVTFVTVGFIFLPILKGDLVQLYSGQKVMTHFTTPILAMVSLIFFHPGKALNWKENLFSMIPEFLYGLVYEIQVPILGNWTDFYGFTLGGKWYAPFIVLPTICGMAYLCSFLLSLGHKKVNQQREKKSEANQ